MDRMDVMDVMDRMDRMDQRDMKMRASSFRVPLRGMHDGIDSTG
jgi:hypothetical protein